MADSTPQRRDLVPFLLATGGLAWAVALLPAAFLAPVYSGESSSPAGTVTTTETLVAVNGPWAAGLLCIPVVLALTAWLGMRLRCSRGSAFGSRLAWSSVALLCAFAVLGSASIGPSSVPAALLLGVAAVKTPTV